MEIADIIIVIYALTLCLPAAVVTWFEFEEGFYLDFYALVAQVLGLPGTVLILLVRLIMYFFKRPQEIKQKTEREELERKDAEAKAKEQQQQEARQKTYKESLTKKRQIIYPNSFATKEIVDLITREDEYPFSIEINSSGLSFYFENKKSSYILRSHGLPNFNEDEERIFAEVLNEKLSHRYTIRENCKNSIHEYGDAFDGFAHVISTHISTIMELKVTRSF